MKGHYLRARLADRAATVMLYCVAGFFLLLLAAFTVYILYKGGRAFDVSLLSFDDNGIGEQFFNTIYLVFLALLISVPVGTAAGIYMAEYAKDGPLLRFIRTCVETLSSLPSIVVGLFGYLIFIVLAGQKWNLLAGAMAVSILNIPLITTVTEDALRATPDNYRQGSFGVGATHWQTIVRVLLPASVPRIITGIILAAGRGFGEAAALLYTAGMSSNINFANWNLLSPTCPLNPMRPGETLALHIWELRTESIAKNASQQADLSAAVLVLMVLAFSLGSRLIGRRLERKITGNGKGGGSK